MSSSPQVVSPPFAGFAPRAIVVVAALYLLAWTVFPLWLGSSFALDVVESLSWGREWQWGYYKHPPVAPIVLHVFFTVFGVAGPYLLSQVCLGATVWLVWRTGCRLMPADRAAVGAALVMGVAYYTWPALEFNHNIAQMPIWAGLGYGMLAALQDDRWWRWLLLGLLAGLGLLTKYSVAIVLLSFGLYMVLTPARRRLLTPGPWLAVLAMVAVFVPHLLWLEQVGWLPFVYASHRAETGAGSSRLDALGFLLTQALNHVPMLLVVGAAFWGARRSLRAGPVRAPFRLMTSEPRYLLAVAVGPGLLVTAMGLLTGGRLRDMWGSPMWAFTGLLVVACIPAAWWPALRGRLLRGMTVWLVLVTVLAATYLAYGAQWKHKPSRMDWPAQALGASAYADWERVSSCPLDVVAGDNWLSGLIATRSPSGPSVLVTGQPSYSPWVTRERLYAHGALWVWEPEREGDAAQPPQPLRDVEVGDALRTHEGTWQIPWPYDPAGTPLTVRWRAYVPAACAR